MSLPEIPKLALVHSRKHIKVRGDYSVYNGDNPYWALRSNNYSSWSLHWVSLTRTQKGKCPLCDKKFSHDDVLCVGFKECNGKRL